MSKLSDSLARISGFLPNIGSYQVRELQEGFTNQVYLLSKPGSASLVLRLADIDVVAFYIDRQAELVTLKRAAQSSVSPALLYQDDNLMLTEFVSQTSLDWQIQHQMQDIERIARQLKKVHQLPLVSHHYQVDKVIAHYLSYIARLIREKSGLEETGLTQECSYLQDRLADLNIEPSGLDSVLCHNDLNPKNVLMDAQQLWFIDWEYTGVGDPLFDLAVVAKSHNLTTPQRIRLLTAYDWPLAIESSLPKLESYCQAYGLREMAWLLLKYLLDPEDPLSLDYYFEFKGNPSLNPFHNAHSGELV
ncbi:choline kinase family protein [Marinomonas sp. THO17]|uniref:choline kinase family protein n=1 Tax=Marinomonas sp. THO17 TaxID=3149048 RepID=UPI00336C0122